MRVTLKEVAHFCACFECYASIDGDNMVAIMWCEKTGQYVNTLYLA